MQNKLKLKNGHEIQSLKEVSGVFIYIIIYYIYICIFDNW